MSTRTSETPAGRSRRSASIKVTALGGPTAIVEIGGLRLLTDPTFDPPGRYEPRPGVVMEKTRGPALQPEELGAIDAVLLSHDQHLDNFDDRGRAVAESAGRIFTTPAAAERLGAGALGLAAFEQAELPRPTGSPLRVTWLPAQHGPDGSERFTGEVTGFLLEGEGLPTVYISGDNAALAVVEEIAKKTWGVDVAILFCGAATMPFLPGDPLTLTADDAARAARLLGAEIAVPLHFEGWKHFTEGADALRAAFAAAGMSDRLHLLEPGASLVSA